MASHHPPARSTLAEATRRGQPATLVRTLAERIPALRNATAYYASDAASLGHTALSAATSVATYAATAATAAHAAATQPDPDSSRVAAVLGAVAATRGTSPAPAAAADPEGGEGHTYQPEAHYAPAPGDDYGVRITSVRVGAMAATGAPVLALCIEGGFAAFELRPDGVFELCLELRGHAAGAALVAHCDSRQSAVVLLERALALHDGQGYTTVQELGFVPHDMAVARAHVAVTSQEFGQLVLHDRRTLAEVRSLFTDRPVFAVAQRWLAYCGTSDAAAAATTVTTQRDETAAESVAQTLTAGVTAVRSMLGTTPTVDPAVAPLSPVVVADLEGGHDIASFIAHNHALQCLAFDRSGTLLATASTQGTSVNVFLVAPGCASPGPQQAEPPRTRVVLLYRLSRGKLTSATITSIAFSPLSAWCCVASSLGTCHFFKVPPKQRKAHGAARATDPGYGAPLLDPAARLRAAPGSGQPDPLVAFSPLVAPDGGVPGASARAFIVGAAGTVTVAACDADQGAAVVAPTLGLHEFSAALPDDDSDPEPDADGSGADAAPSELQWRAQVELRTHPSAAPLRGFRFVTD